MFLQKKIQKKKTAKAKGNRILINITFSGSAGPIRLVVNEGDLVAAVTQAAVKAYARQGRLPVLGTDANKCMLYCSPCLLTGPISPWETIGSTGVRDFTLYQKPESTTTTTATTRKKTSRAWKTWFNIQGLHHHPLSQDSIISCSIVSVTTISTESSISCSWSSSNPSSDKDNMG